MTAVFGLPKAVVGQPMAVELGGISTSWGKESIYPHHFQSGAAEGGGGVLR